MIPYTILPLCAGAAGFVLCKMHLSRRSNIIFQSAASLAAPVMSTVRSSTAGVDCKAYLPYFQQVFDGGFPFLLTPSNPCQRCFFCRFPSLFQLFFGLLYDSFSMSAIRLRPLPHIMIRRG